MTLDSAIRIAFASAIIFALMAGVLVRFHAT